MILVLLFFMLSLTPGSEADEARPPRLENTRKDPLSFEHVERRIQSNKTHQRPIFCISKNRNNL